METPRVFSYAELKAMPKQEQITNSFLHSGMRHYDVHKISNMRHELTILAYEMNGAPVSVLYGPALRLRCENGLGFKMVKWIAAIEFVHDFADLGAGQGGYNEDHEFYGYRMPI